MQSENLLMNLGGAKDPFSHRRLTHRGTHSVNPNSTSSRFQCGALRQPQYSMFTRTVSCRSSRTDQTGNRRHVYNRSATTLFEHLPNFVFQAEPYALEINADGLIPGFFRLIDDRHPNTLGPGIVECDVQAAKSLHHLSNKRVDFRSFRYIGFDKQAIAAGRTDQFDGLLAFQFAPARNHDFGSCLREKYS